MTKITNIPKNEEQIVVEVRNAIEHRATWMYLLLKEAKNKGLEWDDFARQAIYATGCIHGKGLHNLIDDPSDITKFSKVFGVGTGRKVFEMEVVEVRQREGIPARVGDHGVRAIHRIVCVAGVTEAECGASRARGQRRRHAE